ncbi:acetyl-CoA C-acetyltransferase [Constrictibacter sp. MBR-5]|jgi:acetyl-CoA C-acetyltransferase|uniref:acetyl-CoA C-acyltransferase n=1 Tax=Constrictibacter sp. MBR-5 TaxID=3156467 RepID=UPI003397ABD1
MREDPIVIVGMARTPMGGFQGDLADATGPELGTTAIKGALADAGVKPEDVEEIIMGCVLQHGQRQGPARQAAINAGIPMSAGATTINKLCGSAMKATMLSHDLLVAGSNDIMVAGGFESMTNIPYMLPKGRGGLRMGHGQVLDAMFWDGLEDAYQPGKLMGHFAEATAERYQFTREQQDEFAIRSLNRAKKANEDGTFDREMVPMTVKGRKGERVVSRDEQPFTANIEKIPTLRPAFSKDGTVTPANSSSISDGAAALVMMRRSEAERRGLTPLVTIVAHSTHSQEPEWFTTAPVGALKTLYAKTGWSPDEVGLYEINEAFAVVPMAAMKEFNLSPDKVNVHGGACALGHPVGASGARIIATLINAMYKYDVKKGVASLCIGGGEATAMAFEKSA